MSRGKKATETNLLATEYTEATEKNRKVMLSGELRFPANCPGENVFFTHMLVFSAYPSRGY